MGAPHRPAPATWPGGPKCAVTVRHAAAGVHCSWLEGRSEVELGPRIAAAASTKPGTAAVHDPSIHLHACSPDAYGRPLGQPRRGCSS